MTAPAAQAAPTRLALVDDHAVLLQALGAALALEPDVDIVLLHDSTGGDVVEAVAASRAEVLLLDVRLGDRDGLELLERITAGLPEIAVVMLSAVTDPRCIARAFERGAAGYLSKGAPLAEVRAAVHDAAEGRTVLPRTRLGEVVRALTVGASHEQMRGTFLTAQERVVLSRLAAGQSTTKIATDLHITHHTVRSHIQNVLVKLGVHSKLEAAALGVRAHIVTPYEEPAL